MEYPNEIVTLMTDSKTYSIEAHFGKRGQGQSSPMKVLADNGLSRFAFTMLENRKAVTCSMAMDRLSAKLSTASEQSRNTG